MRVLMARTTGFAVPTVAIITALHLSALATVGEAIDGVVSGLWFVACFGVGLFAHSKRALSHRAAFAREALAGALAALALWGALALFWSVPATDVLRSHRVAIFVANSLLAATSGFALGAWRERRGAVTA